MIALIQNMSSQRSEELRTDGARRRLGARVRRTAGAPGTGVATASTTIRRLDVEADGPALERVAGRDCAEVPEGELLGAEIDGVLIAALSLHTGRLIADPFVPTASAALLLRRRAARMSGEGERGSPRRWSARLLRRPGALRP